MLKGFQALINRLQLDDGGPGIHQILEGVFHLVKGIQNPLHNAQGKSTGNNGWRQGNQGYELADINDRKP